uniref:Uncharacterized protein n=1 Tax=Pipistrellus kuhlii TaxID=59472 RepID=A0A7J8A8H3_PIPKU|nr:hypothetical protein mPipKuh1_008843 [Pipistrellus kuhlii]
MVFSFFFISLLRPYLLIHPPPPPPPPLPTPHSCPKVFKIQQSCSLSAFWLRSNVVTILNHYPDPLIQVDCRAGQTLGDKRKFTKISIISPILQIWKFRFEVFNKHREYLRANWRRNRPLDTNPSNSKDYSLYTGPHSCFCQKIKIN